MDPKSESLCRSIRLWPERRKMHEPFHSKTNVTLIIECLVVEDHHALLLLCQNKWQRKPYGKRLPPYFRILNTLVSTTRLCLIDGTTTSCFCDPFESRSGKILPSNRLGCGPFHTEHIDLISCSKVIAIWNQSKQDFKCQVNTVKTRCRNQRKAKISRGGFHTHAIGILF